MRFYREFAGYSKGDHATYRIRNPMLYPTELRARGGFGAMLCNRLVNDFVACHGMSRHGISQHLHPSHRHDTGWVSRPNRVAAGARRLTTSAPTRAGGCRLAYAIVFDGPWRSITPDHPLVRRSDCDRLAWLGTSPDRPNPAGPPRPRRRTETRPRRSKPSTAGAAVPRDGHRSRPDAVGAARAG